jgi:hypothetical protein
MSLRTSRVGFEGFGLQAKPRPAECRRIPRSPPVRWKTPAESVGVFFCSMPEWGLFDERHSRVLRSVYIKS